MLSEQEQLNLVHLQSLKGNEKIELLLLKTELESVYFHMKEILDKYPIAVMDIRTAINNAELTNKSLIDILDIWT
jgi:hypothetical protein